MKLKIASTTKETGALLQEYLDARGASRDSKATVCYGYSTASSPSLNSACNSDKIQRLKLMEKAGVRTVPWFTTEPPKNIKFPLLARKASGYGGTDIVPVFQAQEIPWRLKAGWDWFSQFIPVAQEFRCWVFRGQHLDTYEKRMRRPQDYAYIGRNFRNGFDFELSSFQKDAFIEADKALRALSFDFGAVDMLRGEDGKIYILEVNSAPGVIASKAQATLAKLADCIVAWEKAGYPCVIR